MPFGQNNGSRSGLNSRRKSGAGSDGTTVHRTSGGWNAGERKSGSGRKLRGRQPAGAGSGAIGSSGSASEVSAGKDAAGSGGGALAPDADPYATARSIVLRQLTLAPKSRHQLASKLAERDVPAEVAVAVLDRFEEVQLIDDAEFAMMWVRSRAATRSLARSALKRELAEKGIHGEIAEEALSQVSDDEERDAAEQLVRRKHRPAATGTDRATLDKETRRLVSMLGRKGYSPSLAFGVVKSVLDDVAAGAADDDAEPDFL
ncbi:regulatory protein RecX [Arthrobacter sp. Sr33]